MRLLICLGWLLWALSACAEECRDRDGDGRGAGCDRGPDCDDTDAELGADCSATARACAQAPFTPGCACLAGSRRSCYAGPESTLGVGMCRAGRQLCAVDHWGQCDGEVTPQFEACNGQDEDCDGIADEGVLSPCGGCNPECRGGVWGPAVAPFVAEGEIAVTGAGELTLRQHELAAHTVWVPNSGEGSVSKVDAQSAREVARYRVAGEAPERVAVDYHGDAWVLSPGLAGASYLTKVAGEPERCADRDGDGLQTSDAPEQLLALGEDECVLLQQPIGTAADVARALAVDGGRGLDGDLGGDAWIGLQGAEQFLELDGETGAVVAVVETPGLAPYAAVFDPWGTLWAIDRAGVLARIQPGDPTRFELIEAPLGCYELEGLASDAQGVLTLTGFSCEDVLVYEPRRERWQYLKTPGVLDTRGVAVLDEESWIVHTAGRISRVARDPLALIETFELADAEASPLESIAIGADSLQQLWIVSSMGGPGDVGVLSRFDPSVPAVTAQVPLGRLPRAQGDITGDRRIAEFAPEASSSHVFDGCGLQRADPTQPVLPQPTDWKRVHVAAIVGDGASVVVEARHAKDRDSLPSADWIALGTLPADEPPYDLPFDTGGVVELRLTLHVASRLGAPRIAHVGIEWSCLAPE